MLQVGRMETELLEQIASAGQPPAYDCVIRISRVKDTKRQAELVRQLTSGATVKQIRQQIGILSTQPNKPGEGKSAEVKARSAHGFTARVSGPQSDPERMLEAVSLLIKKLRATLPEEKR
jgi:hypothetical protein